MGTHGLTMKFRRSRSLVMGLVSCLVLGWGSVAYAQVFPSTLTLDTFNRANEGPPPSASWVNSAGTGLKVVGNVCTPNDATIIQASSWNTSFNANQEAFFSIATAKPADGTSTSVHARLGTANDLTTNRYVVFITSVAAANDQMTIRKFVSGTLTTLGATIDIGGEYAVGDQIGIQTVSNTIEAFYKAVSQGTRVDTDITGAGFIGLRNGANANSDFDDFGGGELTPRRMLMGVGT